MPKISELDGYSPLYYNDPDTINFVVNIEDSGDPNTYITTFKDIVDSVFYHGLCSETIDSYLSTFMSGYTYDYIENNIQITSDFNISDASVVFKYGEDTLSAVSGNDLASKVGDYIASNLSASSSGSFVVVHEDKFNTIDNFTSTVFDALYSSSSLSINDSTCLLALSDSPTNPMGPVTVGDLVSYIKSQI